MGMSVIVPQPLQLIVSNESITCNIKVLKNYNFNIATIFDGNQHMSLKFRFKFCPLDQFEQIFGNHKLYPFFWKVHQHRMEYELKEELVEDERMMELEAQLL